LRLSYVGVKRVRSVVACQVERIFAQGLKPTFISRQIRAVGDESPTYQPCPFKTVSKWCAAAKESELRSAGVFCCETHGHGVERERTQEIAAHALLDLNEGASGVVDPFDGEALGETRELGGNVDVAD